MYLVRKRLKDYKDVQEVEISWRAIQYKVVRDVRTELDTWSKTADTLEVQAQIAKAHKIMEEFAKTEFTADILQEFHATFELVATEQGSRDVDM